MVSRSRLRWTLVVALAAHGALAWAAIAARARAARGEPTRAEATVAELEVDVEAAPVEAPPSDVEPGAVAVRPATDVRPEAHPALASVRPESAPSSRPAPVAPSVESGGDGSWTFSQTGDEPAGSQITSAALGEAVRSGVRETVAEAEARKKKHDPLAAVLGGFSAHDIGLGLVPGAELVGLTRDLVRTSGAPVVGHAMLEFQVDSAGTASVSVLDSSSDRAQWDEVVEAIAKAARSRPFKMPANGRGFALTLAVTSEVKTVTGREPTSSTVTKVLRAVSDPLDAIIDSTVPAQRVVAARIVDVHTL